MLPQTSPKQNYTTINTSVKIRGKITLGAHANLPDATPTTASPQDASLGADANLPNATPPNATLGAEANLPNATPTAAAAVVAENTPPNATTTDANLPNAMAEEVATAGEVAVDMVVEVMVEIEVVAAVMGEGVVAMVEVEEEEETF